MAVGIGTPTRDEDEGRAQAVEGGPDAPRALDGFHLDVRAYGARGHSVAARQQCQPQEPLHRGDYTNEAAAVQLEPRCVWQKCPVDALPRREIEDSFVKFEVRPAVGHRDEAGDKSALDVVPVFAKESLVAPAVDRNHAEISRTPPYLLRARHKQNWSLLCVGENFVLALREGKGVRGIGGSDGAALDLAISRTNYEERAIDPPNDCVATNSTWSKSRSRFVAHEALVLSEKVERVIRPVD